MTKAAERFSGSDCATGQRHAERQNAGKVAEAIPTLPKADRLGDAAVQYAIVPDMLGIADAMTDRFGDERLTLTVSAMRRGKRKMLIADLESTIIEQECLDEIKDHRQRRRNRRYSDAPCAAS